MFDPTLKKKKKKKVTTVDPNDKEEMAGQEAPEGVPLRNSRVVTQICTS